MRRRTLLATAGVLFTAGCSEIIPPPQTTVTTRTNAANGTDETPPPTSAPTTQADTTETPNATTDQPTQTSTDTPTEAERVAAQAIKGGRRRLSESLDAYLSFAKVSDPTLLDVTAATQVGVSDVTKYAGKARTRLKDVPAGATPAQHTTADRLDAVAQFLTTGIRCQSSLNSAYSKFDYILGRIYAERFAALPGEIDQLRERRDNANQFLGTLQSETDRADMQAFDRISASQYDQKVTQLQREVTAFGTFADTSDTLTGGLSDFGEATSDFIDDDYGSARDLYSSANEQVESAIQTFEALDLPSSVTTEFSDLLSVLKALSAGSQHLTAAARAGHDYEWDTYDAEFKQGVSELQSSQVAVDRLDSVNTLVEYYQNQY
ncbi:MAG: hypothetical protein ABEI77_10100 [Halorientalis sp.]